MKLLLDENLPERIVPALHFRHRSFLYGAPPKVIWLRVGNCSTSRILVILLANAETILRFNADEQAAFLIIP